MHLNKSYYIILLLLLSTISALAQSSKSYLEIKCTEKQHRHYRPICRLQGNYTSSAKAIKALQNRIAKLRTKGYCEANIDSITQQKKIIIAYVHLGKQYQFKTALTADSTHHSNTQNTFNNIYLSQQIQRKWLQKQNNRGYPFAKLSVEKITADSNQIATIWHLDRGDYMVWDTIITKGSAKIGKRFLHHYLNIGINKNFSEQTLQQVSQRLKSLDFAEQIKPAEIEFVQNKAQLYTYLNRAKSNRFDGIIGLQSSKYSNRMELTGEINLLLNNTFKAGESILFHWQKYEAKSQQLNLNLMYPYIIASTGCDLQLHISKHDSTYITTSINLGIRILQRGKQYVKVFYKNNSSHLIATLHLATATVLPNYADTKTNMWGIGIGLQRLNYPFNPQKGYRLACNLSVGTHTIDKNKAIPQQLYSNIKLANTLRNINWNAALYLPLFRKISYAIKSKGGWLSGSRLFANDLFQIGGLATLRGFNENSFRASQYVTARNELLLIPQKNTAFYLFCDVGYYRNQLDNHSYSDTPVGMGFGFNFATKSGIFSLNYAVGKQKNQDFSLKEAKVHFGFISRF